MKHTIQSIAQNAIGNARDKSNMQSALAIFLDEITAPSASKTHRARCTERFVSELNLKAPTANTYYDLCNKKYFSAAEAQSTDVISRNPVRIYTAYKVKPGTNIVTARVVLPLKRDAETIVNNLTFTGVVPGVLPIGAQAPANH